MSRYFKRKPDDTLSDGRTSQCALSDYWRAPIGGGFNRTTVELLTVSKYQTRKGTSRDNTIVTARARQSSFAGFDVEKRIQVNADSYVWRKLPNDGEESQDGSK